MIRCLLTLLLLPSVLMTQVAALAHGHREDGRHGGEEARPHIHLGFAVHHDHDDDHHHGHSHAHGHRHHHDGTVHHHDDDTTPAGQPLVLHPDSDCGCDHDCDAVYAMACDLGSTGNRLGDLLELDVTVSWTAIDSFISPWHESAAASIVPHPPDRVDSCPIYVRQLTLLI